MKLRVITFVLCLCLVSYLPLLEGSSVAQRNQAPDEVRAVKTVKGNLVGFRVGDYTHATIRKSNGKAQSFFIWKPGLEYFLALHKGQQLEFTYEVADAHIPEDGGVRRIDRLISARAGRLTYEGWWEGVQAKHSLEELDRKYQGLVKKYKLK